MAGEFHVKLTANFERNLEEVEAFLRDADALQAFDTVLDELIETVIPTLEHFPDIGRLFFERPARSVEVGKGLDGLKRKQRAIGPDGEVREYVTSHFLLLYARVGEIIYLLSIRPHRQLSLDFQGLWPTA